MRFRAIAWAVLLSFMTGGLFGQTSTGTIKGSIVDTSGAPIPGAKVLILEEATKQSREQLSNQEGVFEFPLIQRGVYTITVERTGFRKEVVRNIELQVAEVRDVSVSLSVGEVTETVTVEASAGLMQTSEASLSQVIDEKRVTQLPINGRNMLQLISLAPGVTQGGRASATQRQANYGPSFTMGGQRDSTSVVLVDGIEISGMEVNNYPLAIPSLESVSEFRVLTANGSAEFGGNSGAIVNVASKRGSSDFHGTAFEFLRNNAMDARNFFSTKVAPLKRNQFGGIVSGPLFIPKLYEQRDRTFWMFSFEGIRQKNAIDNTALVPDPSIRGGDFSQVRDAVFQLVDPVTKQPFANNVIPQNRITSFGTQVASLWPNPNNGDPARNYLAAPPRSLESDIFATRIDHKLSTNNNLFGRLTINNPNDRGPGQGGVFAGFDSIQVDANTQAVVGLTTILNPSTINELNLGFVRFRRDRESQDSFQRNWLQALGVNGVPSENPFTWGAPAIAVSGFTSIGYSTANSYFHWVSQSAQIVDNLTMVRGAHTLKTGVTFNARRNSSTQWLTPNGSYTFSGVFSAQPPVTATNRYQAFADLLMGVPSAYTAQTDPFLLRLQNSLFFTYFQDDWRVSPNLTINMGLRWEYFGKPSDRYDRIVSFDLATGQQVLPGQNGVPRNFINPDRNNFGPRLGFAWRPFGNTKTSIRGAYGIYYSPEVMNSYINLGFQDPYGRQFNRALPTNAGTSPVPSFTATDPLSNLSQAVFNTRRGVDPNFRDGYVGHWNFSVQRQVSKDMMFEVAYRGSKSTRLASFLNYNEAIPNPPQPPNFIQNLPYSTLGTVNMLESRGSATYHSLQARFERRFASGFSFLGSYVWGKTLSDIDSSTVGVVGGTGNAFAPQTIRNLRLNKGPAIFDRPHRVVFSTIYDLPFFKGDMSALGRIAGGWQIGLMGNFGTGHYLTPASYLAQFAGSRASLTGNPNLSRGERSIDRWYDVSKVVNPVAGSLGNAGKGSILGSGMERFDFVVNKSIPIDEVRRFELRGEFFNALNHPQFDDPILGPASNPQAGKITTASDYGFTQTERVIQVALKFHF